MPRWKPDAAGRLGRAALDLFAERGYENTTVTEIAERAGLTKRTFFRHFRDKREVLFGGDAMSALLAGAITAAPAAAAPLQAVAAALDAAGREAFPSGQRAYGTRRRAVISAHPELQEREALKGLALTAAMTSALTQRGVPDMTARVAAELGFLALKIAYDRWTDPAGTGEFSDLAGQTLHELHAASTQMLAPTKIHGVR